MDGELGVNSEQTSASNDVSEVLVVKEESGKVIEYDCYVS